MRLSAEKPLRDLEFGTLGSSLISLIHAYSRLFTLIHAYSRLFTLIHAYSRLFTLIHAYSRLFTLIHAWRKKVFLRAGIQRNGSRGTLAPPVCGFQSPLFGFIRHYSPFCGEVLERGDMSPRRKAPTRSRGFPNCRAEKPKRFGFYFGLFEFISVFFGKVPQDIQDGNIGLRQSSQILALPSIRTFLRVADPRSVRRPFRFFPGFLRNPLAGGRQSAECGISNRNPKEKARNGADWLASARISSGLLVPRAGLAFLWGVFGNGKCQGVAAAAPCRGRFALATHMGVS